MINWKRQAIDAPKSCFSCCCLFYFFFFWWMWSNQHVAPFTTPKQQQQQLHFTVLVMWPCWWREIGLNSTGNGNQEAWSPWFLECNFPPLPSPANWFDLCAAGDEERKSKVQMFLIHSTHSVRCSSVSHSLMLWVSFVSPCEWPVHLGWSKLWNSVPFFLTLPSRWHTEGELPLLTPFPKHRYLFSFFSMADVLQELCGVENDMTGGDGNPTKQCVYCHSTFLVSGGSGLLGQFKHAGCLSIWTREEGLKGRTSERL